MRMHRITQNSLANIVLARVVLILSLACAVELDFAQAQFEFPKGLGGFGGPSLSPDEIVTVRAQHTPATKDRPALLFVTAKIASGYHVYAVDQATLPDGGGPMAARLSIDENASVKVVGRWQSTEPPKTHIDMEIWTGLELREHAREVTWFAPIATAEDVDISALNISGKAVGQACNPQTCIPFDAQFTAKMGTGFPLPPGTQFPVDEPAATSSPKSTNQVPTASPSRAIDSTAANDTPPAAAAYDIRQIALGEGENGSFVYFLISAFLGGVILNVMPCVLPVIGLKVMSFVQQAGQSRAHALALNCWYSAGIVSVFLALAGLAVSLQVGWGGQFSSAAFNISLIGVVFAMALSLLGMWEIPIPGFVGSSTAVELTEREGPTAAFLKGVLTTLLATPCTGPIMATALTWAVKQPPWMTYSVFGALGLGMASPYLLIGAFPGLIRFLPRPGAWMETFKKIMGLILLATVVWLLTFIDSPLVVPTVALMVGIVAACWWIAQTPVTAPTSQKAYGWISAVLLVAVSAMGSYGWLYQDVMLPRYTEKMEQAVDQERLRIAVALQNINGDPDLRQFTTELLTSSMGDRMWQHFSLEKLGRLTLSEGRTVLVDFTADWCITCKALEKAVLKTAPVLDAIDQANVVTMEADYTKRPKEIEDTIKALGGIGVPLIAIFPANDPYRPIVFADGSYTKSALIDAIAKATGVDNLSQVDALRR